MPSLPTSLIIVVLVVAWLVVLVPMVSKRREEVPEAEEGTAHFRVLERRERRAQPVLARTARVRDAADSGDEDTGEIAQVQAGAADVPAGIAEADGEFSDVDVTTERETAPHPVRVETGIDTGAGDGSGDETGDRVGDRVGGRIAGGGPVGHDHPAEARPRSRRPGRGGYDPHAAERLRQDRFRRRRRTALTLVIGAVAGAIVGVLGMGYGYVATAVCGSLLALYLAYLRRQVRIEEDIRERRAARLERARQIRPNYRPTVAEQVWMHRTGETARPRPGAIPEIPIRSHVRQTVPAAQYGHAVALDLDDSDPAFDELAYYRPAVSRRRAS